jgi:hypothetical protein
MVDAAPAFGEKLYTVQEAMASFGWGYDTARRYFRDVVGILRLPGSAPHHKRRTRILIPESVMKREWERLTSAVPSVPLRQQRVNFLRQQRLTAEQWDQIDKRIAAGEPVSSVAKAFDITRAAIYKHKKAPSGPQA